MPIREDGLETRMHTHTETHTVHVENVIVVRWMRGTEIESGVREGEMVVMLVERVGSQLKKRETDEN